jgi:hypothetical protein
MKFKLQPSTQAYGLLNQLYIRKTNLLLLLDLVPKLKLSQQELLKAKIVEILKREYQVYSIVMENQHSKSNDVSKKLLLHQPAQVIRS